MRVLYLVTHPCSLVGTADCVPGPWGFLTLCRKLQLYSSFMFLMGNIFLLKLDCESKFPPRLKLPLSKTEYANGYIKICKRIHSVKEKMKVEEKIH